MKTKFLLEEKRGTIQTRANRLCLGFSVQTNEMNFFPFGNGLKFCERYLLAYYVHNCEHLFFSSSSSSSLSLIFARFDCSSIMHEVYVRCTYSCIIYKLMLFPGIKSIYVKCTHEMKNITSEAVEELPGGRIHRQKQH